MLAGLVMFLSCLHELDVCRVTFQCSFFLFVFMFKA